MTPDFLVVDQEPHDVLNNTSLDKLYAIRKDNPSNILFSYLNVNSIRHKIKDLVTLLGGKVDILALAETKLDKSFPKTQFLINGYREPYRLDVNDKSGGLLVYVNENIPSCLLDHIPNKDDMQVVPVEINIRKQKWVVLSIYRPPRQCIKVIFNHRFL